MRGVVGTRERRENLKSRLGQLGAHQKGEDTTDDAGDHREDKVHRADVLMVGGVDPALPTRGMTVITVRGRGVILCH